MSEVDAGWSPVRHRSRKNTRKWCRGKPGVPHQPHVVEDDSPWSKPCHWFEFGIYRRDSPSPKRRWWSCRHQEVCQVCGKILHELKGNECPDWPK